MVGINKKTNAAEKQIADQMQMLAKSEMQVSIYTLYMQRKIKGLERE